MGVFVEKLRAQGISKGFSEGGVLKDLSFAVGEGEFMSILGSSGCGKTTLLRVIVGLLQPDSGKIYKDGMDITELPPNRRGIGIVFQNYALFENMTVRGNVEYALKINKKTRTAARQTADEMLRAVGLIDFAERLPWKLSGGQQQRVAIARTLALRPSVILFDEPMSALDVATRLSMRDELKRIQEEFGTTMVYVTHDQEEAFALSNRIMVMKDGEICQLGTPRELCEAPANDYVRSFVVDTIRQKVESLSGLIN